MCSFPQGSRGPSIGYHNHKNAINSDERFEISELSNEMLSNYALVNEFDVFWFYIRFNPGLYLYLKKRYPNKAIWTGPNILFEKAEIGPSDEWERWFTQNVHSDVYCNVADYYLDRVTSFYKNFKYKKALKYCMSLDQYENINFKNINEKENDVLVYAKKRRIDKQYSDVFPKFISKLSESNFKVKVLEYGNYNKEDYFDLISNSKLCVWFSIEDYCSNAQLECQLLNCPIVGTKYNLTDTFDKRYWVDGQDYSDGNWITWKNNISDLYFEGVNKMYEDLPLIGEKPRQFILDNYNYSVYSNYVKRCLDECT